MKGNEDMDMEKYNEFKENFIDDLKLTLDRKGFDDVKITTNQVSKFNESYEAITVTPAGSNVGANVNLEAIFQSYTDGAGYSTVVQQSAETIARGLENVPVVDVHSLTDYDQMKDKLVMEVVSIEANKDMLENIPHKDIEDMAIVYRAVLESTDEGRSSLVITNQLCETFGITPEQLHMDAMENAPQLKPAVITGMSEVMAEMMGLIVEPQDEKMFVATVPDKIHGAGVLAYQDFMDQAAEKAGGDFFILPSSIHELLIVPDNGEMDLATLKDMVKEVNETQVAPNERLTDSVYHYDSKDKVFELGEKFEQRQAEKESVKEAEVSDKKSVLGELKDKKDNIAKTPSKAAPEKAANKNKGGEAL